MVTLKSCRIRNSQIATVVATVLFVAALCIGAAHAGEIADQGDHHPSACVDCLAAAGDDGILPPAAFASLRKGPVVVSAPIMGDAPTPPPPLAAEPRAPPFSR